MCVDVDVLTVRANIQVKFKVFIGKPDIPRRVQHPLQITLMASRTSG